ncbi:MAG TPA: hypothetical protein VFY83_10995 [Anaerolineales bacterium]|nr:hypothetical protein [Anaerolineales bacterium]
MRQHLPDFPSVVQVYALIAAVFAGWTITAFLWKLSAWLLLLNLGEILTILSYAFAANFLESLIVLSVLLAVGALLPAPILRDDFVVRGTIMALGLVGSLMAFVGSEVWLGFENGNWLFTPPLGVLLLTGFLLRQSAKYRRLRSAMLWLADRIVIFLFILLPLFALGLVYVILRNVI